MSKECKIFVNEMRPYSKLISFIELHNDFSLEMSNKIVKITKFVGKSRILIND